MPEHTAESSSAFSVLVSPVSPQPRSGEGSSARTEGVEEGGKGNGKVVWGDEDGKAASVDRHQRVAEPISEPEGPPRTRGESDVEVTPHNHSREQESLLLSRSCGPIEADGARGVNGVLDHDVDARADVSNRMDVGEEQEGDGGVAGEDLAPSLRL